ncbi:STAS domain-containing protein [Proteobacteria bacterium 005FR1]|nr:STAS domain-containing protein [Proteobacteria bacterium 005FR1]
MRRDEIDQYMDILNFDEYELRSRLEFFEITDDDFRCLAGLRDFASKYTEEIVEKLYELILGHPETRTFFPDAETVERVKRKQTEYFMKLFRENIDLDYIRDRLRIGFVHEKIGMPPKWYLGAYRRYLQLITDRLIEEYRDRPDLAEQYVRSIEKIIFFEMAVSIDTYIAAHVETVTRHKEAIRELSTPVIKVHDRVLLLPVIGTVDTHRAQQIMETVLLEIVEEQAKVMIIDIAGVAVVDTRVADHLIRTTKAIRFLGAEAILTGISPNVARTVVQLGVDIGEIQTTNRLADGIELALHEIGKAITPKNQEKHLEKARQQERPGEKR